MVTGRLNAQAAVLRGALACEGKLAAVVMFQRCLPGPPGSTGTEAATVMPGSGRPRRRYMATATATRPGGAA